MLLYAFLFFYLAQAPQPRNLLQRGLLNLQHGDLAQAREDLEEASRSDPRNPFVWSSLAETYLRLNDREDAMSAAAKAEKLGSGNPVVGHALAIFFLTAGDAASGLRCAETAAETKPSAANLDLLGRALIANGKPKDGISQLDSAWNQAQTDPQISFDYADALLHAEDFTRAADVLTSALEAHPENAQLTVALGVARYGQRRFEDAIVLFLKTIKLAPDAQQPYVFLGKMLDQAGSHLPEITAGYERWAAANPDDARAELLLAKALLTVDPRSERALELLKKSVTLDPKDWEAHYELGVLLEGKHDYAAAATELSAATELEPNQPMPHYHLARVYDRLGKPERAKAEREIHERLTAPKKPN